MPYLEAHSIHTNDVASSDPEHRADAKRRYLRLSFPDQVLLPEALGTDLGAVSTPGLRLSNVAQNLTLVWPLSAGVNSLNPTWS